MRAIWKSGDNRKAIGVFIILFILTAGRSQAQQDAMYSQYMFNMVSINPAYTGSREATNLTVLRRWQWTGIDGAPKTTTFTADSPIRNQRMGLGLIAVNDRIGATNTSGLNATYSYRIPLGNEATLALGLLGGFTNYRANLSALSTTTNSDPALINGINKWMPNFGTGIYYSTKKFYAGLSAPHLINNSLSSGGTGDQRRHYFLMAGYVFRATEMISIKPSTLVKYVSGAPVQVDVNVNVWYNNLISLGLSLRSGDAVVVMTELQINNQLHFGYAYDMATTRIRNYNSGSHELLLRYSFNRGKDKEQVTPKLF